MIEQKKMKKNATLTVNDNNNKSLDCCSYDKLSLSNRYKVQKIAYLDTV